MAKGKYAQWISEDGLAKAAAMAIKMTDAEMAEAMGIAASTFYEWLKRYPEMAEAITRARAGTDARAVNDSVEGALLATALGGVQVVHEPVKVRIRGFDERGKAFEREEIVLTEKEVYIKPDVKAQIFWLTNRVPERWRNRVEAALSAGEREVNYVFREATSEEAAEYAD